MNDALALAKEYEVPYIEASALTGCGISEVFETLVQEYLKKNPQGSQAAVEEPTNVVKITDTPKDNAGGSKKKCC